MKNWTSLTTLKLIRLLGAFLVVGVVSVTLLPVVIPEADGAPPRTLPHDHSSRGRGGDLAGVDIAHPVVCKATQTGGTGGGAGSNILCAFEVQDGNDTIISRFGFHNGPTDLTGTTTTIRLGNFIEGGGVAIQGVDEAGTNRTGVNCTFNNLGCSIYFNGGTAGTRGERFRTMGNGIQVRGDTSGVPTLGGLNDSRIRFESFNASLLGQVGWGTPGGGADGNLNLQNDTHGGNIVFEGENGGGTNFVMMTMDPDTEIITRFDQPFGVDLASSVLTTTTMHTLVTLSSVQTGWYRIDGFIEITSSSAEDDIDIRINLTGGTLVANLIVSAGGGEAAQVEPIIAGNDTMLETDGSHGITIHGFANVTSAGDVTLQAAKDTDVSSDVTVDDIFFMFTKLN